jgi:hypothetical protein
VPILVRSDLSDDLAADMAVGQPIKACRDLSPGDHLDRRQTDGTLDDQRAAACKAVGSSRLLAISFDSTMASAPIPDRRRWLAYGQPTSGSSK